jgi:hypothetical protein
MGSLKGRNKIFDETVKYHKNSIPLEKYAPIDVSAVPTSQLGQSPCLSLCQK